MKGKRDGYISWDEYFMGVAKLSGMRSKDPHSQVGACIVSPDNKILSMGYNGFPMGCSDDEFPWAREGDELDTKYFYVTHSELNAILNYRGGSLEGAKLYVSLFPCNECAKAIIQAGIKTIVYECDKYADSPAVFHIIQKIGFQFLLLIARTNQKSAKKQDDSHADSRKDRHTHQWQFPSQNQKLVRFAALLPQKQNLHSHQ